MLSQNVQLLSDDQIQTIHEASLSVLQDVGIRVLNETARDIFCHHGCRVNAQSGNVCFPQDLVEQWRQTFPSRFRFYGREPRYDLTLPDDSPAIATTGIAPDVLDIENGQRRRATSEDLSKIAHLVNMLPGIDLFFVSTLLSDVPEDHYSLNSLYIAAKKCLKPIRCGVNSIQDFKDIILLGEYIAGGTEAFQKRPFFYFGHTASISPLTLDKESTSMILETVRRGLPSMAAVVPNSGLTAPLTLAGTLVLANAEFLANNLLIQMVKEATPILYYSLPATSDMRNGAFSSGGIESGILQIGCAQLARFYGVPSGGYAGATNAKLSDAQAGFEKGMSPTAAMLGGLNMVMLAGLIDALMVFSYPQLIIDSEIGEMIKRVYRGISLDKDELALDLIKTIGSGGSYIDSQHTLKHMRTAMYYPHIASRQSWQKWWDTGKYDTQTRALQRVWNILSGDNPAAFSPDVDAKIRATFSDSLHVSM
ncbi:MAG: trimethylamine methyltransferase family protein [Desulfohalobiaceae bacterium]|nr:trimethylamine methyltransferase family protein [Desulfohalobiaceae bacterium]